MYPIFHGHYSLLDVSLWLYRLVPLLSLSYVLTILLLTIWHIIIFLSSFFNHMRLATWISLYSIHMCVVVLYWYYLVECLLQSNIVFANIVALMLVRDFDLLWACVLYTLYLLSVWCNIYNLQGWNSSARRERKMNYVVEHVVSTWMCNISSTKMKSKIPIGWAHTRHS